MLVHLVHKYNLSWWLLAVGASPQKIVASLVQSPVRVDPASQIAHAAMAETTRSGLTA